MKINKVLKRLIDDHNINTLELSKYTDIPQSVIYRIITGETESPTILTASSLANYFGITVSQLIGETPLQEVGVSKNCHKCFEIPLLSWEQIEYWPKFTKKQTTCTQIITDLTPNNNLYAVKTIDNSMLPIFTLGAVLIIDGKQRPKNRSYILIKPTNCKDVILRQLVIDNGLEYLRTLNQEANKCKIQLFTKKDRYYGAVLQSKQNYEDS